MIDKDLKINFVNKRGSSRVKSAKTYATDTIGERVRHMKNSGWKKRFVQDVCDFCLKYKYMKRHQLPLRKKGKKFMCMWCYKEPKNKEVIKKERPIPCWDFPGQSGVIPKSKNV